jgi:hypothetical protein
MYEGLVIETTETELLSEMEIPRSDDHSWCCSIAKAVSFWLLAAKFSRSLALDDFA